MRKALALAVLGATVALALAAVLAGPPASSFPRLAVLIVIDQFRFDRLSELDGLFGDGLRTLLDQGASFTNARFRHGITLTAPGHAAISTGMHPSHTGITANNFYDPRLKKRIVSVFDPEENTVGGAGSTSSPRRLLVDTLGDRLKRKHPDARVVSLALKDRSAILLAGREADGAYWFSTQCGCWVTSSYYHHQAPVWMKKLNHNRPADRFAMKPWERLLPNVELYQRHAREDAFPAENFGEGHAFPHKWTSQPPDKDFYVQLMDSGFCDEVVLEGVLAAIEGHELGSDNTTDLLAVSFAGLDRVGHPYGPLSQEALDTTLRLDRVLGRLFRAIDRKVGLDQTVVGLTSDHGALPLVEYLETQGVASKRFPKPDLPDAVTRAVLERFPKARNVVAYFDPPHIFFDLEDLDKGGVPRAEAEALGRQALLKTGFVERVYTHADLLGDPQDDDPYRPLYVNSFHEPRSQHLIVRLKKNHYVDRSQGSTGHGSPYDYDRHVPLMLWGPGIKPGRYGKPAGPEDLAPTLGMVIGLQMPTEPDGRLLREALE